MAIKFEIMENICTLSKSASGWTKELNLVSWNDREPKFDLREWNEDHSKMSKGITFTNDEMKALKEAIEELNI